VAELAAKSIVPMRISHLVMLGVIARARQRDRAMDGFERSMLADLQRRLPAGAK
jgi:hypothetical protein